MSFIRAISAHVRRAGWAVGLAALLAANVATAAAYEFEGTITSFADPNNLLNAGQVIGRQFRGTITFDVADIGNVMNNPDRIGDITVESILTIGTPNDRAFVMRQDADTLVAHPLPFDPVTFSSGTTTRTCPGDGTLTIGATSVMSFSFGCTSMSFGNVTPLGLRIGGAGTYRIAGSVPEPATWLLLLSGFAIVGAALRGRQARSTAVVAG